MKIKFLCSWILLIVLGASCKPSLVATSIKSTIDKATSSTVALIGRTPDDTQYPYCAGVWLDDRTMLTAAHCAVEAADQEKIAELPSNLKKLSFWLIEPTTNPTGATVLYSGEDDIVAINHSPKKFYSAKITAVDLDHDLALAVADSSDIPVHDWLHVADRLPKVGDKVYIVGHPGQLYFTLMDGMIAAIRLTYPSTAEVELQGPFLQVFSSIYSGNSGGPIISERGEILGIVSFVNGVPNQGFAIACVAIQNFLIKHKLL